LIESKIVLEGFIQETSPDELHLRLGSAPDTPDGKWHDAAALRIIHHQPRH
jgi:hypothetical protein